ncbi:hypothetical protein D9615_009303 [Tricholomella constricta]|uniref:Uncharacterized protein n=1 Tax=Tricholomella constricta TaxID=117010 RepID=A0A8H5GWE3_9AGAR|nr:hypothetical protein D9615_009303 [Tricholomella constricta]
MFPVDPRDFVNQEFLEPGRSVPQKVRFRPSPVSFTPSPLSLPLRDGSLTTRTPDSVLPSYHYGNLTRPSRDRPRMGFLSTVPRDADDKLKAAVAAAAKDGGNFPSESTLLPFSLSCFLPPFLPLRIAIRAGTNRRPDGRYSDGVPAVKPTNVPQGNPASRRADTAWGTWAAAAASSVLTMIWAVMAL